MGITNWQNTLVAKKELLEMLPKVHTMLTLHKEQNILKVHDLYRLSILKFYFKLVNNNLPHYFNSFTPQFSLGHMHYNLRSPVRQLPMIKHEFSKQSLRYKLIATLNEISDSVLAEVHNLSQKQFIDRAMQSIIGSI